MVSGVFILVHSVRKCSSVSISPSMHWEQILVLTREPGLSAPARLYGQTVFTESVHRQCFPESHITHDAQVACHGVLSI